LSIDCDPEPGEEIFGPVLAVLRWDDEVAMVRAVNALDSDARSVWKS
jgi:acyl-CoA reductase-like NAD-dependent aldehyde dehydrogenase